MKVDTIQVGRNQFPTSTVLVVVGFLGSGRVRNRKRENLARSSYQAGAAAVSAALHGEKHSGHDSLESCLVTLVATVRNSTVRRHVRWRKIFLSCRLTANTESNPNPDYNWK